MKKYGLPHILLKPTIVNFLWSGSTTSKITPDIIQKEELYIRDKYGINQ
jgi:hypothetical protein